MILTKFKAKKLGIYGLGITGASLYNALKNNYELIYIIFIVII